jgi:hypothetical protein
MSSVTLLHSSEDTCQLWYKIRDTIFGENGARKDLKKALELAAICKHSDAIWLTKLFAGLGVSTDEEARQVFLVCESGPAQGERDGCYRLGAASNLVLDAMKTCKERRTTISSLLSLEMLRECVRLVGG